ncbi:MAG TPA: amidase [Casimicrobiaceae bacterium]|nr:amidase [Casimicrobiaceae bacterium]
MANLALATADELLELYRARRASPVEVVDACLAQIAKLGTRHNAFVLVDADGARSAARASETRWQRGAPAGALDGVPVTIKDLILTRGWPTLRGSRAIDPAGPWNDDAPVTARLREANAIILGKTTTPEMGWKAVTDSPLIGVARNPWDPSCTPGGSSGGAGIAAATGMGALHVGTDGGGSIRVPASFCGIFGLKPSFGRVPAWPLSPTGTVSHLGPMTRGVADAATMMNVITRPDARDWHSLPYDPVDYRDELDAGIDGMRVAWSPRLGQFDVDAEVAAITAAAVQAFVDAGAHVDAVDPPLDDVHAIFRVHWWVGCHNAVRGMSNEQRTRLDPGLARIADDAKALTIDDYLDAVAARGRLGAAMRVFHTRYDLLVTPSVGVPSFAAGRLAPEALGDVGGDWTRWASFSYPFNLTQQPAASVPCGFTKAGLPVGLQIAGPMHDDRRVLRAARAFERLRPWQSAYARFG